MSYLSVNRVVPKAPIQRFEFCFVVLGLFFHSGGLPSILTSVGVEVAIKPIRYAVLAGSLYGACLNREKMMEALRRGRWIWPLTLLTISSFLWAADSGVAIQSLRSDFIPITLFGLYVAIRFSRKEFFEILYICTLIASVISFFYAVAFPSIGRHPLVGNPYPGAWRGIFGGKNSLGINLTINCALVGLKMLYEGRKKWRKNLAIYLFLCVEVILSKSLSSLIFSNSALGLIGLYRHFRWKGKITVFILYCWSFFLISLSVVLNIFWTPFMNALGRDPTMSARTLIWDYIMNQYVIQKPVLGYGRGGLWLDASFQSGLYHATAHSPAHAHSGYVELVFSLGYVGLFCFIISLVPLISKSLKLAYHTHKREDVFPLVIVFILLSYNYTESLLLRGSSFFWLLYVTISCSNLERDKSSSESLRV